MTTPWSTAIRFARRELRGGIRGFRIFIACLALGVAAIAGVGTLASGIVAGLESDGRALLGGDVEVRLTHRTAAPEERAFLERAGRVSEVAQLRAMAFQADGDRRTLIELKAVDAAYPLYGAAQLDGAAGLQQALAPKDGVPGAVVDDTLMVRLGLKPGDRIRVGDGTFAVRAVLTREPDRATEALSLGPRVMIALDALRGTGLLAPGSLVYYAYRTALPVNADAAALQQQAVEAFPDAGWRIRTWRNGNPGLQQFVDRVGLFMVLIGLTALLVGGVGVGNAVKSYLDSKTSTIATLKCIGAEGGFIFRVYLAQVMMLALFGIVIGIVIGAGLPWLLLALFGDLLPLAVKTGFYAAPLAMAALYGVLIALAFALWPLARAREVVPAGLFRDLVAPSRRWPRPAYIAATAAVVVALAVIAVFSSDERRFTLWFVAGAAGSFLVLRLVAEGLMRLARKAGRPRLAALRFGLANLHRPGAPTPSVVLSLGLGLTLLVMVALLQGNLNAQVESRLPQKAPAFFFVDIQSDQMDAFEKAVHAVPGAGALEAAPSLRGRITRVKGISADQAPVSAEQRWVLRGDRGLTYAETLPANSTLVEGEWWPKNYDGPPLLSLELEAARGMGVTIGDTIAVNVLGREIEARIANLRRVEWGGFTINFVMVFSPNTLAGAPHTSLATVRADPKAEEAIFRAVTDAFPNVSTIRVKDALDQVNSLLGQIGTAIRGAAAVTLLAGVLVLAGAIIAGRRARTKDAVLLKVLGATRADVLRILLVEYALLGLVTAVIAGALGWAGAWLVITQVMRMDWTSLPQVVVATAVLSMLATMALGLAGTWRTLSQRPAPVLRQN
jgi:putative ABC transport system permease protein